jgi:hypothetical protein
MSAWIAPSVAVGLFAGVLACLRLGRRLGERKLARDPDGARAGVGAVEGSIFGLVGLLLAFTFSGAAARFDQRRMAIADEANAIGTAWLRLDLLPPEARAELRERFRDYLDSRIATYDAMSDPTAVSAELRRSGELQALIWARAVDASAELPAPQATMLLLPALNQMFDVMTIRTMQRRIHPKPIIYEALVVLSLAAATLVGYAMSGVREPSRIHCVIFAAVLALALYVILDLEYPRIGLIQIDAADEVLHDLRASMSEG